MSWFGQGGNGWGSGLMVFGFLAFWGLVIYAIVVLIRRPGRLGRGVETDLSGGPGGPGRTPQQLLAGRFASGEISEGDYTDRLAALRKRIPS